jgi:hypothetical protein
MGTGPVDPAVLPQAAGVSMWLSWVVNLLAAEYWLQPHPHATRRSGRAHGQAPAGAGHVLSRFRCWNQVTVARKTYRLRLNR